MPKECEVGAVGCAMGAERCSWCLCLAILMSKRERRRESACMLPVPSADSPVKRLGVGACLWLARLDRLAWGPPKWLADAVGMQWGITRDAKTTTSDFILFSGNRVVLK